MDPVAALSFVLLFEMGNIQRAHSLDGCHKGVVGTFRVSQLLACRSQNAQHLSPVESLTLAMVAKAHRRILGAWFSRYARELVSREGIEPSTRRLRVCCSAN